MSVYWYFECLDHTPALRSADEFTQHTDDDWYRQGAELAGARPVPADDGRYWNAAHSSGREQSRAYFRMNAIKFLHEHPTCRLGAVNEYGEHRALSHLTPTAEPPRLTTDEDVAEAQALLDEAMDEPPRIADVALGELERLRSTLAAVRFAIDVHDRYLDASQHRSPDCFATRTTTTLREIRKAVG